MATIIGKYKLSNTSDSVVGTMKMVVNNEGNISRRGERMKMLVDDEINRSPRGVMSDGVGKRCTFRPLRCQLYKLLDFLYVRQFSYDAYLT